jgi:hypothetical protein
MVVFLVAALADYQASLIFKALMNLGLENFAFGKGSDGIANGN